MATRRRVITQCLTTSQQVARTLEWRHPCGRALCMAIGQHELHLTVASHPCIVERKANKRTLAIEKLSTLPLNFTSDTGKKVLDPDLVEELEALYHDYNICALLVHWPLQRDGWCGAPCGRVLHTLDLLVQQTRLWSSDAAAASLRLPTCLWDYRHYEHGEDEWGRDARFGEPAPDGVTVHVASQQQYNEGPTCLQEVWFDFCHFHWPELAQQRRMELLRAHTETLSKSNLVDRALLEAASQGDRFERRRSALG